MEDAEKMAALKKAYAEIILNTAKESAARILASERRSAALHQSLAAAKEEAVATMLRLKAIMDAKIREVEMKSFGQVRRIQELEAQLNEAEDVISSLRGELERVNSDSECMKNNPADPLIEQDTGDHEAHENAKCQEDKHNSDSRFSFLPGSGDGSAPDIKGSTLNQRVTDDHLYFGEDATEDDPLKDSPTEDRSPGNTDLASIIMRIKDTELYRNGCTQRIRAFEKNLLTVKVPPEQTGDQLSKDELIFSENKKSRKSSTEDTAKPLEAAMQTKTLTDSKELLQRDDCGNGRIKLVHRFSPRKQRTRSNHLKSIKHGSFSSQERVDSQPGETLSNAVDEKPTPEYTVSCSSENRKTCQDVTFENANPALLPCNERTIAKLHLTKQNHMDAEDRRLQSLELRTKEAGHEGQMGDSTIMTSDRSVADNSSCKEETSMSGVLKMKSDSKDDNTCESSGTRVQAENDKFLKYTFQRKRKRGSLNNKDENIIPETVPEKKSTSKRTADKKNASMKPQKPGLAMESPRNNRRLVQVARQLISLSARRW